MNTNHQQLPSGIESEVKYTLQFWLLSNGKVMTEKDGLCNPFPPNCIESAHPFIPFQHVEKKALPDWLRAFHTDVSHS